MNTIVGTGTAICFQVSSVAVLTVTPDTTLPTVVSASGVLPNNVQIVFSEPIQLVTATNRANYSITNASGSPSRNNVAHAARSRDGFIGSSFAARLPQSECQTDLTRSSDPASSQAGHTCRESRHRIVVVRSDTRGHSETIGPTLYTQTGALASGQRMAGGCGRRYAATRAVGGLRAALRADGPAQIDGARGEAGAE